jgi:hypothetical protein
MRYLIVLSFYMKAKHRRILEAIFAVPTRGGIVFSDIEALILALGGDVREGSGFRIVFELKGADSSFIDPTPARKKKSTRSKNCASG